MCLKVLILKIIELLEKVKASCPVPFMFLTSKDDETDELIGLRQGADDFIRKPFSQRLVLERIRAVLRRHSTWLEDERDQKEPVINQGELLLDPSRHLCSWKEKSVDLTVTEFLILKLLARHPGHVKTKGRPEGTKSRRGDPPAKSRGPCQIPRTACQISHD